MGKASNAKKVNRAAATGGGRTAGKRAPVGWYSAIALVVVLGVAGVALASKDQHNKTNAAKGDTTAPVANKDHWHVAYGFNLCGTWASPLNDGPRGDQTGIHTHGDGLVHTHPFVSRAAGKNATFGKLIDTTATSLSATSVDLKRDGEKFKNGDKCGKKAGELTATVFKNLQDKTGKLISGDPDKIRLKDGELITISFNPTGFKATQPPSANNLSDPGDVGETPQPTPQTTVSSVVTTETSVTPTTAP